jgi:hypothetical protein
MGFNVPSNNQIVREQPTSPAVWTRQPDWVSITGVPTGTIYFLASDATNGKYTIRTTSTGGGNIYIDWGDGSTPDTISTSTSTDTEHTFTTGGTSCTLGYNTWKISVTSDSGTRITNCNIVVSSGQYVEYPSGLLEAWYGDTTIITAANYFNENSAGMWMTYLEYVKLPEGMTETNSLERVFFNGCRMLKKVDMPISCPNNQTLQETFYECSSLVDPIIFPQDMTGVTTCSQTFFNCYAVQKVVYPPTLPNCTTLNRAHQNNSALGECVLPILENCTAFDSAFNGCFSLTSLSIPKFKSSGTINLSLAFSNCASLKSIKLPSDTPSTTSLNLETTFNACNSLLQVVLPPNVKITGSMASTFSACNNLVYVSLPMDATSVTAMNGTFQNCFSLQSITLPSIAPSASITMASTFTTCYSLPEIVIPSGYTITSLQSAFQNCRSAKSITLPNNAQNSVSTMASMATNCYKLRSIVMPTSLNGVTTIVSIFNGCFSLESVVFPSSMSALIQMGNAFNSCQSLETVTLPTTISGNNAGVFTSTFINCFRLKNLVYPATLTSPTTLTSLSAELQNCYSLKSVTFPAVQMTGISTLLNMVNGCRSLTGITNSSFLGNTSTGASVYLNGTTMATDARSLQSLSFSCKFSKLEVQGTGSGANQSALTSLRLLNNGSGQYGGTSPHINVSFTSMDATALNQLFTDLPTVTSKTITVVGTPGAATCTTSIATAKGWTVTTV